MTQCMDLQVHWYMNCRLESLVHVGISVVSQVAGYCWNTTDFYRSVVSKCKRFQHPSNQIVKNSI